MEKIINPCKVKEYDGKFYNVFCKIEFDGKRLSISGVVGPKRDGNCAGGCGQIDMEFYHKDEQENDARYATADLYRVKNGNLQFCNGWNTTKWYKFLHYWKMYHLNDMQSACEHQRAMGWTYETHHGLWEEKPVKYPVNLIDEYDTGARDETLPKWNEYKGHDCPVCGYSIGSAWLTLPIPDDVIEFLFSLPDTEVKPAWV